MAKKTKINKKTKLKLTSDSNKKTPKVKSTKAKAGSSTGGSKSKAGKTTNKQPNVASSSSLDELRNYLQYRVSRANETANEYMDYEHLQGAYQNARRTLPSTRRHDEELFSADIKTRQSMLREIARMDVFETEVRVSYDDDYESIVTNRLNDAQSDRVTQIRQGFYKGAFGGQWKTDDNQVNYDTSRIRKDFADEAFDIYHRLVEENQSEDYLRMLWSRDSRVTYGSESVIIAIYDMVSMTNMSQEEILDKMREEIKSRYEEIQDMDTRFKRKEDYGKIKR